MPRTATVSRPRARRIDVAPLHQADHSAYLTLLDLTTSGMGVPVDPDWIFALAPFQQPFAHGPPSA
ncbi:hypothetical protein [Streptomyces botrytidirepellens]|uniref:Uncharacterized protein n=1 Tax=Streptomyces botrytidirepellens TaxID=2486417 RepID=A0A3M8WSK7_9ACTN|nr:hypothetical protein [Streptomyces botrytidirepellens]RNG32956.1 hypothetical protein EEJ42_07545 [Streptomyces botrytidirepellens]